MSENSKVKTFIGRNPTISALKTKFLDVLGSSTEVLNGISNKLTLIISSSGSDGYDEAEEEEKLKYEEGIDYTQIDFESRRLKARRAHEEVISRRYRQPNLLRRSQMGVSRTRDPGQGNGAAAAAAGGGSSSGSSAEEREGAAAAGGPASSSTSSSTTSSSSAHGKGRRRHSLPSSTTRSNSLESRHSGGYKRTRPIPGARRSELDLQRDMRRLNESLRLRKPLADGGGVSTVRVEESTTSPPPPSAAVAAVGAKLPGRNGGGKTSNSSTATSLPDELEDQMMSSTSLESSDWCNFIRSESENSVPSWASSISLDKEEDLPSTKDFMQHFLEFLFEKPKMIATNEKLRREFALVVRGVWGRKCFIHFLLKHIQCGKCVSERTFCALVELISTVLYECKEMDDFLPAFVLMNFCFLVYKEIEVPGCEAYHEYLFIFLKSHPLWDRIAFWRVAIVECLRQTQRSKMKVVKGGAVAAGGIGAGASVGVGGASMESPLPAEEGSGEGTAFGKLPPPGNHIAFQQIAAYTCNIHALGASEVTCRQFFEEQAANYKLNQDQVKLISDNIRRMYYETEKWGAEANYPPRI